MLVELAVRELGVIADLRLVLGGGMTALTGETGAGKTLVVQAIELLMGGRTDAATVRSGAAEAVVDGRFLIGGTEVVLTRVVPAGGRSRAYVDGRMAPVAALAEAGAGLVDLHGQHAHQSLLAAAAQRAALDRFGAVDLGPRQAARRRAAELDAALDALGGDDRARARELDLLRYQVGELAAAGLSDPGEDGALAAEEDRLAGAAAHREAATSAHHALSGDGGVADGLGAALAALAGRAPLADLEARLRSAAAEVDDVAAELRDRAETMEEDPERLDGVRIRRARLHELRRKYGDTLADVMAYEAEATARVAELTSHDERAARLAAQRDEALAALGAVEAGLGATRRAAAPLLAAATAARLGGLALPGARFEVEIGDDPAGDDVRFLLGANPGEPALALARTASGGELARTMLALRLALQERAGGPDGGPGTLVFDEVDAGIGGEAALAVGRSLADLAGPDRQVLVVTHLPQVAAFADHQIVVRKIDRGDRVVAEAAPVVGADRVAELSRMLSGHPESPAARGHAEELLAVAGRVRPLGRSV